MPSGWYPAQFGPYKSSLAITLLATALYRTLILTEAYNRTLCCMVGMKSPYPKYFCSQSGRDHSQVGCVLAGTPVRVGDLTGVDTGCCVPVRLSAAKQSGAHSVP